MPPTATRLAATPATRLAMSSGRNSSTGASAAAALAAAANADHAIAPLAAQATARATLTVQPAAVA